jgi:YD repeat-containing protein
MLLVGGNETWNDTVFEVFLNPNGRVESRCLDRSADGNCQMRTVFKYDSQGNWFETFQVLNGDSIALGSFGSYEYGKDGRITFQRSFDENGKPETVTQFFYDEYNRLHEIHRYRDSIDGSKYGDWYFGYNASGRLDTAFCTNNLFTMYSKRIVYDAEGKLLRLTDHFGNVLAYEWGPDGRIATLTSMEANGSRFVYKVIYKDENTRFEPDPLWGFIAREEYLF